MKNFVIFAIGAVAGAVATYFGLNKILKTKYEKECQKEIDDYKTFVKEKVLKGKLLQTNDERIKPEVVEAGIIDTKTNEIFSTFKAKEIKEDATESVPMDIPEKPLKYHHTEKKPMKKRELKGSPLAPDKTVEISEDEYDIYVETENYEDIVLNYDVSDGSIYTFNGDIVTRWDDDIMENIVDDHEVGDEVFMVNEATEVVYKVTVVNNERLY